jgi:argininosuccinate lyase
MSRFSEPQDPLFRALNTSVGFDYRLAPFDIEQSLAHARMLARQKIIAPEDLAELERGLEQVRSEIEANAFQIHPEDEDIHMAIERRVTEIVGPVGGKLHTARSRNDQVATDVAMFVRAHADRDRRALLDLLDVIVDLAERHLDWAVPGYTHLQRAQPVYLSHHLLAWFWKLERDSRRFAHVVELTSDLPLGAGALAGVNFDTDRGYVAEQLGFPAVAQNSLDAVSSRDFVLDYLAAASICATHLSQLGAEIVLWSSEEFGFCEVSDSFASGSSIMPQKKNPDAAELLRGKAPRVVAHFSGLHGVLHGLPLTYNKDLQEDKERLFDAVDTLELTIAAAAGMLAGISFNRERMADAAADEFPAATDIADLLVKRGMPFRQAHGVVAGLVRTAVDSDRTLSELSEDEVREHAPELVPGYHELLAEGAWLESKISEGGTALPRVQEQLQRARAALGEAAQR